MAFHTAHKFAVLAHSPAHYARLGRLVAAAGRAFARATLDEYQALLMEGHAVRATRGRHTNVLTHMTGYFKRELGSRRPDFDGVAELMKALDQVVGELGCVSPIEVVGAEVAVVDVVLAKPTSGPTRVPRLAHFLRRGSARRVEN